MAKTGIIVHCSATPPSWMVDKATSEKVAEIRRWHVQDRGWRDIGYAYLIDRDGTVAKGRDLDGDGNVWEEIGAHTKGKNKANIGICLIGGHGSSENDAFADHFTTEQNKALRELIRELEEMLGPLALHGHNEFAAKACPGFKVSQWYASNPPRSRMQSQTVQGGAMAGVGTCGTVATDMASELQTAAGEGQGLLQYAPSLKWAFVVLTLAGIGLALYRRMGPDWKRGRR